MSVFISVSTDAFGPGSLEDSSWRAAKHVRRPTRGIQLKPDTYATIRVVTATGVDLLMIDSGSANVQNGIGRSAKYSNFLLQAIDDQRAEKQQIVETFGEDYVYFFGERPRVLQFSGVLMNTKDFNWKNEWWKNYNDLFRGTRLAEEGARLYIYFDDVVVGGYVMGSSSQISANDPYKCPFSFQLFVTDYVDLSTVGSVFFQEAGAYGNLPTDTVGAAVPGMPVSTASALSDAAQKAQATKIAAQGATGGITAFLANAQKLANSADFKIKSTLQEIQNTLYSRQMVFPADLSSAVLMPPIDNQASFAAAPVNQPIHANSDEYVVRAPAAVGYDKAEVARVQKELALRTPEALDKKARAELAKLGIDATRRSTGYLLLGRGAFAGSQVFGSFGIRQADGALRNLNLRI